MKHSILMLEHDDDDRYITQEFLNEIKSDIQVGFVQNSDQLFDHLEKCDGKLRALPSLLLVDYHSTPLNAAEVIRKLRGNKKYGHLPVVVVSGTTNAQILEECYRAGANSYVVKPSTVPQTTSKILNFVKYWFETVELP